MLVLGIETSCDDTAVALVVDGRRVLSNVFASQTLVHEKFGGVVPELASRSHLEMLPATLEAALEQGGVTLGDVEALAVTRGPGLIGALMVGVMAAKALAAGLGRPLVGINHLQAHLAAGFLADPSLEPPFLGLVVSGGHTSLVQVVDDVTFRVLGQTRDDAAGEVLDKVGRQMGLPFPAGKYVEEEARGHEAHCLPRPRAFDGGALDFSFSGLKTAVSLQVASGQHQRGDLCALLQGCVVENLRLKVSRALELTGETTLVVSGGVAANGALRQALTEVTHARGVRLVVPPPVLCTDNGAMTAALGARRLAAGVRSSLEMSPVPSLKLEEV